MSPSTEPARYFTTPRSWKEKITDYSSSLFSNGSSELDCSPASQHKQTIDQDKVSVPPSRKVFFPSMPNLDKNGRLQGMVNRSRRSKTKEE